MSSRGAQLVQFSECTPEKRAPHRLLPTLEAGVAESVGTLDDSFEADRLREIATIVGTDFLCDERVQ